MYPRQEVNRAFHELYHEGKISGFMAKLPDRHHFDQLLDLVVHVENSDFQSFAEKHGIIVRNPIQTNTRPLETEIHCRIVHP